MTLSFEVWVPTILPFSIVAVASSEREALLHYKCSSSSKISGILRTSKFTGNWLLGAVKQLKPSNMSVMCPTSNDYNYNSTTNDFLVVYFAVVIHIITQKAD